MIKKISKLFYGLIIANLFVLLLGCQQATTIKTVTYKIEYDSNGHGSNPKTIEVVENTEISSQLIAPLQDSDGYYCTGWLLDNKPIKEGFKITQDIKLTANWEKYLTVTYIDSKGNKIWPLKNIKSGHILTNEQLPTLKDEGNIKFKGWYIGENQITSGFKVIQDINLTAVWGESYTVSFKDDKTSYYSTDRGLNYGDFVNVPNMDKEVKGYTFDGWYNGLNKITTTSVKVESDLTIIAHWIPIEYKIDYVLGADGLTNNNPKKYTIEDEITFDDIIREGYIFKGWYYDSNFTEITTGIAKGSTGNKKFYANWIEDGNVGEISSLDTRNTTNVCSSIISFNTETPIARSLTTNKRELKTLTYFENGDTKPFIFSTSRHKKVLLSVSDIVQISDTVIAIKYDSIWKVITIFDNPINSNKDITISFAKDTPGSQALVNLKTGEYFNFNDYQLKNMTSSKDYIIAFGKNGKEAQTLYKIDINNIKTAVPLNNADFDPLDSNHKIYSWGNDFAYYSIPDGTPKLYYLNKDKPFININRAPVIDNPNIHLGYMHFTYIEDEQGNIYMYSLSECDDKFYITGKVTVNENGNCVNYEDVVEKPIPQGIWPDGIRENALHFNSCGNDIFVPKNEELYETNEHLEINSGCLIKAKVINNNLELSFTDFTDGFSNTIPWQVTPIIYKNIAYYLHNGQIGTSNYSTMTKNVLYSSPELITTSKNTDINLLTLVDNTLVFYQTMGATKVGTYSIPVTGLNGNEQPKLLAEHKSDVKDMVYLKF